MIYLDNAATTYPKPESVYKALDEANRSAFNAGRGEYDASRKAFETIEKARRNIASFINVQSNRVIFTSSATESLNMIINGISIEDGDNVYISPFEHNAVVRPLKNLQKKIGFKLHILPFEKTTWLPDLDRIRSEFAVNRPKAVFITHVSNTTGYRVPYREIFEMSANYNGINVLDCAQSYGILVPEIKDINYIVFAGHKSLYASFGIAGFIKLKNDRLVETKYGGTGSDSLNPDMPDELPYKYEAGSANIVAISSLNSSINWLKSVDIKKKEEELTGYLIEELGKLDNVTIYLPQGANVFGIVSFNLEGYSSDDVASILNDEFEICVRSGYHCAPDVHDFIGSKENNGTVRVSVNYFNTMEEIDVLINTLKTM